MQYNLPLTPSDSTLVAESFSFQTVSLASGRSRVVWYRDLAVIDQYDGDDLDARNHMIYLLVECNGVSQRRVADALGLSPSSVKQIMAKMRRNDGQSATRRRRGHATVLTDETTASLNAELADGKSLVELSEETGICLSTLRKGVSRGVLHHPLPRPDVTLSAYGRQPASDAPSQPGERALRDVGTADGLGMACERVMERTVGLMLTGAPAESRFEACRGISGGGVLAAVPALVSQGLFARGRELSDTIAKGYYTITHVLLLLAFMALLRIKSPERLRGWSPGELGRLMGLDRIPEVSTLRRYLDRIGPSAGKWGEHMASDWFSDLAGSASPDFVTVYVDGHVRVYSGDMTPLPKRYSTRHRLCVKGMTDYWVNDASGRPLLCLSRAMDEGLQQTIRNVLMPKWEELIPKPSREYRDSHPDWVWFRLVCDRAASSAAFIREMREHHILVLTYKMRVGDEWDEDEFKEYTAVTPTGNKVTMLLAERTVELSADGGRTKVAVREIRRLQKGEKSHHQTTIITSDMATPLERCALLMFARWNQENYFKYMTEQYGLDHLLEYATGEMSLSENVVNPRWREQKKRVQAVQGKLDSLNRRFHRTYEDLPEQGGGRQYEQKKAKREELLLEIRQLDADLAEQKERLKNTERKVAMEKLEENERFAALAMDRKLFVDVVKMTAYRAETAMAFSIRKESDSYGDEARAWLERLYRQTVDIIPDQDTKRLTVRIYPMPEIRQCEVVKKLLLVLNESETTFPGTNWTLCYEMLEQSATGRN